MSRRFKDWLLGDRGSDLPRILLLDGGVSTHLEKSNGSFPHRELWSSSLLLTTSGRQAIVRSHLEWLKEASVNVLSTVTYQCHFETKFWPEKNILTEPIMDQMWKDGIELAQTAASQQSSTRPTFVVASSGCYGAAMANGAEYTGAYDCDSPCLRIFHARKLQAALKHTPDGVALETIPSVVELQVLRDVLLDSDGSMDTVDTVAVYISLACRNKSQLNDGTRLATALKVLDDLPRENLHGIGLNCCDVDFMLEGLLLEIVPFAVRKRIGVVLFPNSGEAWDAAACTWRAHTGTTESAAMADKLMQVIESVERIATKVHMEEASTQIFLPPILIGGCCRTTPSTLAALRERVDRHLQHRGD